mmetsp:Transcript_18867/g.41331  ORF Transcript_18867/g.41331 Transcript_18867/m.41331 type:complete len:230 (+) Transcript_18867:95-784(+)
MLLTPATHVTASIGVGSRAPRGRIRLSVDAYGEALRITRDTRGILRHNSNRGTQYVALTAHQNHQVVFTRGRVLSRHVPSCSLQAPSTGGVTVYVVKTPLVGLEGIGKVLGNLYPRTLEHSVVVLHCEERNVYRALDFLPSDPTNPQTALRLLSGREVPGLLRVRNLPKLPRQNCKRIGPALMADAMDEATLFHHQWDTRLRLFSNDCRTHANALVEHLTGTKNVLPYM